MLTLSDRNQETRESGYSYGMNSRDNPLSLLSGECQLLRNCIPGDPLEERDAIYDVFTETTARGYGDAHTKYIPPGLYFNGLDSKDYLFVWAQNVDEPTIYSLELVNITDRSRQMLMTAKFAAVTHFSMLRVYNSVYIIYDQVIETNYTHPNLTNNIIVFWNGTSFEIRSWGLPNVPAINSIICDPGGSSANPFQTNAKFACASIGNTLYIQGGINATGRKATMLSTTNFKNYPATTVIPVQQLYDEDGNPYIDPQYIEATFPEREGHCMWYFDGKLWLAGGESDSGLCQDVWFSLDYGETWELWTMEAGWSARRDFVVVVHNSKMILYGGYDGSALNDVWESTDGFTWTETTVSTPFTARRSFTGLSYDNKIWAILGDGMTDVWSSDDDGENWTQVNADIGVGSRKAHGSVVYDGKMWIVGGIDSTTYKNDVYYSTDGDTWTTATLNAGWIERGYHGCIMMFNKIWILGGYDGSNYLSTTYYSTDGVTWATPDVGLTQNKYYSNTFTFVRRTDSDSVLSSMTNFNFQAWEVFGGKQCVGVDEILLTGTVSLSGAGANNLTGSGTLFTSELSTGKRIRIDGTYTYYTVSAIQDDTNATISNDDSDSYSAKKFSLLPDDGDPITNDVHSPGIDESPEISTNRIVLYNTYSGGRQVILLPDFTEAIAAGATHMRHFRTTGADSSTVAQGLSHQFCYDISLIQRGTSVVYFDAVSDEELAFYETHTVETTGYSIPPPGRHICWDQEHIWFSTGNGNWFYTVGATTDPEFPQKYASLYQPRTQKSVYHQEDNQRDTGSFIYEGDLYFIKSGKIGILDNCDPANTPRDIAHELGCDFPNTITFIDHPILKQCVLMLSESMPIVLRSGGLVESLGGMKHAELWGTGLFQVDPDTGNDQTSEWKEMVSAIWHKNSWRIIIPNQTIPTIYGFHCAPDGKSIGSFIDVPAPNGSSEYPCDPAVIVQKKATTCYGVSNKSNTYRLFEFLKNGTKSDRYGTSSFNYSLGIKSKRFGLNAESSVMAEISDILLMCDLLDTNGLACTLYLDGERFNCPATYTEAVDTALAAGNYDKFRNMVQIILKEGCYGRSWDLLVEKACGAGTFKFRGIIFHVEPKPEFGAEFYSPSSAVAAG